MTIGIDARSLEGFQTGVGRYLTGLLKEWALEETMQSKINFRLYFKGEIPKDAFPPSAGFSPRVLTAPFRIHSNALFQHLFLPLAAYSDAVDVLFSPSYILPAWYAGRSAVVLHDIAYASHPEWFSPANRALLARVSKRSARKADVIFVDAEFTAGEVMRHFGIEKSRIRIIPLAADRNTFRPIEDTHLISAVKRRYGIGDCYVMFVGSFFKRRHIPELVKAFERISSEFPRHQLFLVGENHTYPRIDIESLIRGVNQRVGERKICRSRYVRNEDLPVLYSGASVFVWLSEYEGFGLPLLESLACGTPVVTTRKTSIPEVVGEAAFFVEDPFSPDEIAAAIRTLLAHPEERERLQVNGYEQVKKFSWAKTAEETLFALKGIT